MDKITIHIIDHSGESRSILANLDSSLSLMEVVRDAGYQMGNCGGMALCASCHCNVKHTGLLTNMTDEEQDMLDQLHNSTIDSRLICQIFISKELDGIELRLIND